MADRLTSYIQSNPKRAAQLIVVLVVAFVVSMTATLAYALDWSSGSPYPSEVTPLSLTDDGVVWTGAYNISFVGGSERMSYTHPLDGWGWGCNYSNLRYIWDCPSGGIFGSVANQDEQELLSSGTFATVEKPLAATIIESTGMTYEYSLVITDLLGDGSFGWGDRIMFKESNGPFEYAVEGEVNTIALVWLADPTNRTSSYVYTEFGEYRYVINDGDFLSWGSEELLWSDPWWE